MSPLSRYTPLALPSLMVACFLSACSAGQPPAPPLPPMADTTSMTTADADFVQKLNTMNLTQIALAKVAQTHAGRSDFVNLAATITKDLTGNQDKLTALAAAHSITLATKPSAADQKSVALLEKRHGAAFDRAYASALTNNNKKMQSVIEGEVASSKNADLIKLANDTKTMLASYQSAL